IASRGSLSRIPKCSFSTSRRGQYVIPWPYERQRPVRSRGSDDSVLSHCQSSRTSRVLPTPASPTIVISCGSPTAATRPYASCNCASSRLRPTKVGLSPPLPRERDMERALGVVFVRRRSAERSHHRVTDELLDRAARPLDLSLHRVVEAVE